MKCWPGIPLFVSFAATIIADSPGGNNFGMASCSGEFILLLNNDTLVTPDFLQPLVEYLYAPTARLALCKAR